MKWDMYIEKPYKMDYREANMEYGWLDENDIQWQICFGKGDDAGTFVALIKHKYYYLKKSIKFPSFPHPYMIRRDSNQYLKSGDNYVIFQDDVSCFRAKNVEAFLQEKHFYSMTWPASCPDFSMTKMLW